MNIEYPDCPHGQPSCWRCVRCEEEERWRLGDFDEIAAAREIVKILCSGLGLDAVVTGDSELAEALESVPPEKLRLMLKLMREKDDAPE